MVEAGYKVGVVRQMETAALKAAGADRNKQFKSKTSRVRPRSIYFLIFRRIPARTCRAQLAMQEVHPNIDVAFETY